MNEMIWLNGEIIPMATARISPEDRGFQFADGVYEVIRLYDGKPFTLDEHLERLERSAAGIRLTVPMTRQALAGEIRRFMAVVEAGEGMIYLQLTRGASPRNHVYPTGPQNTLLFHFRPLPPLPAIGQVPTVKLVTVEDDRWRRCWIKSIALLPNVLAKNTAVEAGADEAVFLEHGEVSECSASNLFIVKNQKLITPPVGPKVLPGITRAVLLDCAKGVGFAVEDRAVRLTEAMEADEIFITSTTREISPVVEWDGKGVGRGGGVTRRLHQVLRNRVSEL